MRSTALWLSTTSTTTHSWKTGEKPTAPGGRPSSRHFQTSKRPWTTWWWSAIASSDASPTEARTLVLSTECLRPGTRSRCVPLTSGEPRTASSQNTGTSSTTSNSSSRSACFPRSTSEIPRARRDSARPGAHRDIRAHLWDHYGTDVFSAIVPRPALALADDPTLVSIVGRAHDVGDRRLRVPGVAGLVAAILGNCSDRL